MNRRNSDAPLFVARLGVFWPLLRESLAVLAAILVAFSLDAWWDQRIEHQRMLDALDAVADELQRNVALVDETRAYNRSQAGKVFRILEMSNEESVALSDAELFALADFPNYSALRLEAGAITAFVQSGLLAEVPNRDVRIRLAALPILQAELDEEGDLLAGLQADLGSALVDALDVDISIALARGSTETTRALVNAVRSDENLQKIILHRTFIMQEVYGAELDRTRQTSLETLAIIGDWLDR